MKVGIVILNYNNEKDTIECVKSIFSHCKDNNFVLCIVDNCSESNIVEAVWRTVSSLGDSVRFKSSDVVDKLHQITYIENCVNTGYANGNNVGLNYLRQFSDISHYLILNNDILFTMDIIKPLAEYLLEHPDVAVVSPLLYDKFCKVDYECARYEKGFFDIVFRATPLRRLSYIKKKALRNKILIEHPEYLGLPEVDINLPSGSCMMFTRKTFDDIGFFDPHTFLYFEEDIIWQKLKQLKMRSVMLPSVSCIHLGARSTSLSSRDVIGRYYSQSLIYYLYNYSGLPSIVINCIGFWLRLRDKLINE